MDPVERMNAPVDDLTMEAVEEFLEEGPAPEYQALEASLGTAASVRRVPDVWKFIQDAVDGTGGFSSGDYIQPFAKEQSTSGSVDKKYRDRQGLADYDAFPGKIAMAAWDVIVSKSDMIRREGPPALDDFWKDADRNGTPILDALEYSHRQARLYGVGWVVMDRPAAPMETAAQDSDPSLRPYIYGLATKNVVRWEFDVDGRLLALIILEPEEESSSLAKTPFRVWTPDSWSVWDRNGTKATVRDMGKNGLGVIPVVSIWNERPEPGTVGLGKTEMVQVSRLAQSVYNQDSEAREVERKAALFLALPVRDISAFDSAGITVGLESILTYDGQAGEPKWVSPDLAILDKLEMSRARKIDAAYELASLRALVGNIQTSSGYHAEVEFSKTERRISRHAAVLEDAETKLARLYLKFLGQESQADQVVIQYPREYGVRDLDKLVDRTQKLVDLDLGEEVTVEFLRTTLQGLFPRKDAAELDALAKAAAAHKAKGAQASLDRVKKIMGAQAQGAKPQAPVQGGNVVDMMKGQDPAEEMKAAANGEGN